MTIRFSTCQSWEQRKSADLLVLPYWAGQHGAEAAYTEHFRVEGVAEPLALGDFVGDEGSVLVVYKGGKLEQRVALLGLGREESATMERFRRCYGGLLQACKDKKVASLNILLPSHPKIEYEGILRAMGEGLLLANYEFLSLKRHTLSLGAKSHIARVCLIGASAHDLAVIEECSALATAVHWVRDIVNGNADDVTPQYLESQARWLGERLPHTKLKTFTKRQMEKAGFGLLLAVNRGSPRDPVFLTLEYSGNRAGRERTVLVGKGITYDTGGLNLKITGDMEEMKSDMAGAAVVLGSVYAAATLKLKVNVTAVVASTENCIDGRSYKPGDVYVGYSGKSVEIGNTDAEGRLILADALAYATKSLKPTRIIDVATLTGAMVIALGKEITGLFSNSDSLAEAIRMAGDVTHERVWRLPLVEEYLRKLNSDFADIKNIGGRPGSAILAALFLGEFVGKVPWAHLDIAGTALAGEAAGYTPKHATGVGVRLLVQLLKSLS